MSGQPHPRYGGQALVEGVMIRGARAWAVALRHPDGRIVGETGELAEPARWQMLPLLRGVAMLGSQFRLGWRLLGLSAAVNTYGDRRPMPRRVNAASWAIALSIAVTVFVLLPLVVTERHVTSDPLLRLAEGLIKFTL